MSVLVFDVNKYSFKVIPIILLRALQGCLLQCQIILLLRRDRRPIPIAKVKIETNPNLATRHSKQGHGHYVSHCLGREGSLVKRYEVLQEL
jgi:hypothetical protein